MERRAVEETMCSLPCMLLSDRFIRRREAFWCCRLTILTVRPLLLFVCVPVCSFLSLRSLIIQRKEQGVGLLRLGQIGHADRLGMPVGPRRLVSFGATAVVAELADELLDH